MEPLRFHLNRVEEEPSADLDACKLLGAAVMPEGFLDRLRLKPTEYFIAQIRCDAFPSREPFPDKGYLYVFLDINSLKPRVVYTEKEPAELIDDLNSGFDEEACGDPTCLQMKFDPEGGCRLFSEIDPDIGLESDVDTDGKLVLLQIDAYSLPEIEPRAFRFGDFGGLNDGYWVFLIKEEDLKKRDFRHVEFVEVEA